MKKNISEAGFDRNLLKPVKQNICCLDKPPEAVVGWPQLRHRSVSADHPDQPARPTGHQGGQQEAGHPTADRHRLGLSGRERRALHQHHRSGPEVLPELT